MFRSYPGVYEKRLTDLTRRRPNPPHTHRDRTGGIVEIALPVTMLDQLPTLAACHNAILPVALNDHHYWPPGLGHRWVFQLGPGK